MDRLFALNEHYGKILAPKVGQTPRTLVWTKNKAKLYRYKQSAEVPLKYKTPLLIVYALVNKPFILDLIPGRSFIEYLVQHGVDVYLLDWGSPGPEDRSLRFDDLVMDYLPRAVRQVLKTSETESFNILGYCLGGVLTTLYTATHPSEPFNSTILLASPTDFSDAGLFTAWLDPRLQDVDKLVDTLGNIPAEMIGFGTKLLKPYLSFVGTYQTLWENAADTHFVETWGAMNRWIEEPVPFLGEAFRQWIKDFYHGNKLIKDELVLNGQTVRLANITAPLLNIAAEADHLIQLSQTAPTMEKVSSTEKEFIIMPGGHIGLVTSRKAVTNLWPKTLDWLARHSTSVHSVEVGVAPVPDRPEVTPSEHLLELVNPSRLAEYLADVAELSPALPISSMERVSQGQSNLTFRVTLTNQMVILRRPPPGPLPPRAHDVLREFRVMSALKNSPVPVPRPIAVCADPSVIGAPFYLMEVLPGDAIRFDLPPALAAAPIAVRRSIGEQLVDALATLHMTDPAVVGLADLGKPTGYIARQLRRWKGQLEYARTRPVPDLDWTAEWLERNMPADVERPSIVHGDYRLDNVLFTQEPPPRLLGIVDWEMATLGDPLADLGWLLAFWHEASDPPLELKILPRVMELPGFPKREELAQRYAERMQHPLPDLRFYIVLALWKMAVLLEGHWARLIHGTAGDFDFSYLETAGPAFAARIRHTAEK